MPTFMPPSQLPLPPTPPAGGPPPMPPPTSDPRYNPNMMSTADSSDQLSPTSLIMNYMKSKGVPLNAGNISQALRDVGNGVIDIPGLRAGQASTDAEDKAAMAAARGRGGSGGGNTSAPPVDLTQGPTNEANWQPPGSGSGSSGLVDAAKIAGLVLGGGAGLGGLGYGAVKLADRFNPAPTPLPGASVPPPVDPGAGVPGALDKAVPGLPVENVPMRSPEMSIQAPPASSLPSSPLNVENVSPPGSRGLNVTNTPMPPPVATIQAPPAASLPSSGLNVGNTAPLPGGLGIDNVPMPKPMTTIQAPPNPVPEITVRPKVRARGARVRT